MHPRHPVGGVGNRLVRQVDVTLCRFDQRVTQKLGDGHHVHTVHGGGRSPAAPQIVNPQSGQSGLVADAVPLGAEVVDGSRRGTSGKEIWAIVAVARDGVDDRAGGARQPDGARAGLAVGQKDALALDPVPFQGDDLATTASGQHQQSDDGDDVRTPELVAGEHGVEPGHFLGREEPLLRFHRISPGVLAGIGVVGAVSPKLGHAHHDGQDRHGAVGIAAALDHGGEPVLDVLDRDGVHGEMAEGGQDVLAHDVGAVLQGDGLPVPGVAFEKLLGECVHGPSGGPGSAVLLHRVEEGGDQFAGLAPRLRQRHGVGVADGGRADAPAHGAAQEERAMPARADAQAEAGNRVVPDIVLPGAGFRGADAPGEGGLGRVGHGSRLPVLGRLTGGQNRKRSRRRFSKEAGRRGGTRRAARLCN